MFGCFPISSHRLPADNCGDVSGLLPQVFFVSILLVALAVMARGAVETNARLYNSQVLQATSALDAARDSVVIESVTPGAPAENLTIVLRNDGRRDIANWTSVNLIVIYTTTAGTVTESLWHTDGSVAPGMWAPTTGGGSDAYEPGILNLDETIELRAHLSDVPQSGSNGRVMLTLDGGATFSHIFTIP